MVSISLCMIVKNEEAVLARCLDSVAGVADEIIIVDTGSTDATPEIAAAYTDRVYAFPWVDDFAAARNEAFSKATCDYCLWLDADDVLLPEDREKLLRLKEELDPAVDMVMMKYHVAFDAQGQPTFTYERERLIRKDAGYRWVGAVHEVIPPQGRVLHADIAVCHRKLHAADPDRNLRIFEKLLAQGETLDPRQQYYYARELYYHGRYEEAARRLTAFLDAGEGWVENNIGACRDLAHCYEALGRPARAIQALLRSLTYDAPRSEVCCDLGRLFMAQHHDAMAVFWYELALNRPVDSSTGGFHEPDCHGYIPCMQLCVLYDRLGDRKQAEAYNERAAALKPDDAGVAYNRAYFAQKKAGA